MKIAYRLFWAMVAHIISPFVKVRNKYWVFASDRGNLYREGSKYFFEYMLENHPDFHCTYIVRNPHTYNEIKRKGYPVEMNFSWRGIQEILKSDAVFYTQGPGDMYYGFKKKGRTHYYVLHGQSLKRLAKINHDVEKKYRKLWKVWMRRIGYPIFIGHNVKDSSFVSATSEFTIPFLRNTFGMDMPIKILGMPRNDGLFKPEEMKNELWLDNMEGKFIVTYMPTHRLFGKGELSPIPFLGNSDIEKWLHENNVIILVKQHPNMIDKTHYGLNSDVIIDITKKGLDPQVVIWHSDVLISDYSSVWLDFLLLRRPIIHYLYDDFGNEDIGLNINMKEDAPGCICKNEKELFELIKNVKNNYSQYIPREEIVRKFFKYVDGNSSERYYNAILREKYNRQS